MPANYLDTPATEREDVSLAQMPSLDYSIVQPFASPSKNPAEDLRNRMRGARSGALQQPPMRTPRLRSALLTRPNPAGPSKQEFTPLLRSAKRKELLRRSVMEKENALLSDVPPTPAGFRSSYGGDATQLPMNSSMMEEDTGNSIGLNAPHAVSSSMLSATPMPTLPRDGQVVLEQGNVLSLRDQEAKLDQITKENFGLKLKIHFLEEALRKTGTEYHQATLKENAELKTERLTIDADMKRQRKRVLILEQEVEEQRQRHQQNLHTNATTAGFADEIAKLQHSAQESQRLADERLKDMEDLRAQLEEAQQDVGQSEELQDLKDDIQDLQRELRARDDQLEAKAQEIEALQAEDKAGHKTQELEHMQEDIDDLEAELKEKEDELNTKNEKILTLEQCIRDQAQDGNHAADDLQQRLDDVEKELKHKIDAVDNAVSHIAELKERLESAEGAGEAKLNEQQRTVEAMRTKLEAVETQQSAAVRHKDEALRDVQRELSDKDGEIRALQQRLSTARGSWDAEAQQADARLQEKDNLIRDRDVRLREKDKVIEQRDDELSDLEKRLRATDNRYAESSQAHAGKIRSLTMQITDLERELHAKDSQSSGKLQDKEKLIESRSAELRSLQVKVNTVDADVKAKNERVRELETANRQLESTNRDNARRITNLERQAKTAETPSKKEAILAEQSTRVSSLQRNLEKLEQAKHDEINQLENELEALEKKNVRLQQQAKHAVELESKVATLTDERDSLQRRAERLQERTRTADKDHSILGHQNDELSDKQAKIENLEDQVDRLEAAHQRHERQARAEIDALHVQHGTDLAAAKQTLEDEIVMLESALDEADAAVEASSARITKLEHDLDTARLAKETGTPARERNGLRLRLGDVEQQRDELRKQIDILKQADAERDELRAQVNALKRDIIEQAHLQTDLSIAEAKVKSLQTRIITLEEELEAALQEKTIGNERHDLHELVKQSRLEAESLQLKLNAYERRPNAKGGHEPPHTQLDAARIELDEQQAYISELESRLSNHVHKEKQLRQQLREQKEIGGQLNDMEMQLGDKKSSSSGHARRESELRRQLRDAKVGLESVQQELLEKEDRILVLMKREQALRQRLKRGQQSDDDATQVLVEDLQAQLNEAEADVRALQQQLAKREKTLNTCQRKELELRSRIKDVRRVSQHELGDNDQQHQRELKGLAKQIKLLRAKCFREENFRKDLVYTKRWFLMQVEMYNECNQADLRLLEEMGITPDQTFRQKKPSLRSLGMAVLATIRMQKLSEAWAENRRTQERLVRTLDLIKQM